MLAPQKSLFSDVLAVSGFCHGGAPVFLLGLALCCRSTCQFRRNSEKSNHMLSATSHIELEFLTKFLNMSKLQNRLILLYQSLPLQYSHQSLIAKRDYYEEAKSGFIYSRTSRNLGDFQMFPLKGSVFRGRKFPMINFAHNTERYENLPKTMVSIY